MLGDGDTFNIGNIEFQAVHSPGHTPEHMSYLVTDRGSGADVPMGMVTGELHRIDGRRGDAAGIALAGELIVLPGMVHDRLAGLGAVLSGLSAWAQDQAGVITELDWISQPLARWMLMVNGEALAGTVMNWLPWVAVGLTVAGLYWILCARVDDHVNEVR